MADLTAQQIIDGLRNAAVAAYGEHSLEEPALAAALVNLATALWRIQQEPLSPMDSGPLPDA